MNLAPAPDQSAGAFFHETLYKSGGLDYILSIQKNLSGKGALYELS